MNELMVIICVVSGKTQDLSLQNNDNNDNVVCFMES